LLYQLSYGTFSIVAVCLIDAANIEGLFEIQKAKVLFFAFKRQPADS